MNIITPAQSRAARGILNWGQPYLAERAGLSKTTISQFEIGKGTDGTARKIFQVFDTVGLEFLKDEGVKRRNKALSELEGDDANAALLDDVYYSLRDTGGEVLIAGLKEVGADNPAVRAHLVKHIERLKEAGISERILIEEGDTDLVAPRHWYRCLPKGYFTQAPFQLYGSKLALITWGPPDRIILIDEERVVESFRSLFNFAWEHARLLTPGAGL
ncbi:MAG: helix-turn-helix transcriptional regulator [Pseudomonadota bacterium]|nr:helix-turn-helix transcriptional regulator [Pseudomonadota bacterium]